MKRRSLLLGAAGLVLPPAGRSLRAEAAGVWTRLAGRPEGGLPILLLGGSSPRARAVIIFSHGLGGRADKFRGMVAPWVEAGFILALPEHLDSLARGGARRPSFAELKRYAELRIDDIRAVLGALPTLAGGASASVIPGAVGVGGYSFGAWTAAVIAGATVVTAPGVPPQSFADPRPRAFLLMAAPPVPEGADAQHPFDGLTRSSFATLERPLMLIDGTADRVPPRGLESYRERLAAYELSPPGSKYLGLEREATHVTLSGVAHAREPRAATIAARSLAHVEALSLPFWRGFVGGDRGSVAWLDGPAPFAIDPPYFTFARRL